MLILGGTGFIGPHFVRAAFDRGHHVSVFNRGKSHSNLPAQVERLVGDRTRELSAIQHRDWDAVLDLSAYVPAWVRSLGEALEGRVGQYAFISTVAAYENPTARALTDENAKLRDYSGADAYSLRSLSEMKDYGPLKVVCEGEAKKQFGGKTLIVRPGYIAGPGDDPNRAIPYWVARMERGGQIMVPGEPTSPVQFIDVRDLAGWVVRMIERRATGTYNAVGPSEPTTLGEMLQVIRAVASVSSRLSWVLPAWLEAREDVGAWALPLYFTSESKGWAEIMRMSSSRAQAQGLVFRSMRETMIDTRDWCPSRSPDCETGILDEPWPIYLKREEEVLAEWAGRDLAGRASG